MREYGRMTNATEEDLSSMLMETRIQESMKMASQMAKVSISGGMARFTMDSSRMV